MALPLFALDTSASCSVLIPSPIRRPNYVLSLTLLCKTLRGSSRFISGRR